MYTIKQPSIIIFGENSAKKYSFPKNCLVVCSKGAKARGWLEYLSLKNCLIFDNVEPNPSIETANKIIAEFKNSNFSHVIGLGGGSSLDISKFVGFKLGKSKILIPTTFGSGSEVTRISVLKVDGKKKSFHDDALFANVAIIDPYFMNNSPKEVIKNSAIDACAQCTEAYDSKIANPFTRFMCEKAFDLLEAGIIENNNEKLAIGSLISGLGFGNSSTTLGHALSYVFSNEGIPHGHALAFTTTVAHKFNESIFYERFLKLVKKLGFKNIGLKQNLEEAANLIFTDKKHIDNNPKTITKKDIIVLLKIIKNGKVFEA